MAKEEAKKTKKVAPKEGKKAPKKDVKKVVKKETKKKENKKTYVQEVKTELKKVKWPTKEEMLKYSIAVIVFIIIFGLYFYGLDAFFAWLSSLVKGL